MTLDSTRLDASRVVHEDVSPRAMRLYVMDAWVRDPSVLVDLGKVRAILRAAAGEGAATVLGDSFHVFGNGAVTGVLILAQSHLSIHTWPELSLANVDLLTYGDVDGARVMRVIGERLGADHPRVSCIARGGA